MQFNRTSIVAELKTVRKLLHDENAPAPTLTYIIRAGWVGNFIRVKTTALVAHPDRNTVGNATGPDFYLFGFIATVAMPNRIRHCFRKADEYIRIQILTDGILPGKPVNESLNFADAVEIRGQCEHNTY